MESSQAADTSTPAPAADAGGQVHDKHIVDVLIEERAPRLASSAAWPVVRPALYAILNYAKARQMADAIAPMSGRAALDHISDLLDLKLEVTGLERLPRTGPLILLCNHPTGITDGIAVFDAIKDLRPDLIFYANSDAHRVCPRFEETLIPVEWVKEKRTRERTRVTLKMTEEAFAAGRPLVVFPAGRLAQRKFRPLTDMEWMSSAISLARKYKLAILPVHVSGPDAFWFHTFNYFSNELRDMTLFHELLNKHGKTYRLTFGPLMDHDVAASDSTRITRQIKFYVENVLSQDRDAAFDPDGPECPWRDPPKVQGKK